MAFDIKISGLSDLVRIEDLVKGMEIKQRWEDFKMGKGPNLIVEAGSWSGTISSISYFKKVPMLGSSTVQDTHKMVSEEYSKSREELLKESPSKRAKHIGFFNLYYTVMTGERAPEDVIDKAVEIQKEFYTLYPRRTITDPAWFKEIIPKTGKNIGTAISLIERVVIEDMRYGGKNDKRPGSEVDEESEDAEMIENDPIIQKEMAEDDEPISESNIPW